MTTLCLPTIGHDITSLPLVRSELLGGLKWIRHGISTRVPGLGLAEGNVGYTAPRDVEDAWRMRELWTRAIGLNAEQLVRVRQVHGDDVCVAGDDDGRRGGRPNAGEAPIADAIITATPSLALMTLHADCVPILLADPRLRLVAAIHAGWRGTLLDIAGATIRGMSGIFGTAPADVVAFIGPSISVDAYAVGAEVVSAFETRWPDAAIVQRRGPQTHLDLKRANVLQLGRAGVSIASIEMSPLCTVADQARLFSHRAQGPNTGRFAAIIGIAPDSDER